jgi:glycosidase
MEFHVSRAVRTKFDVHDLLFNYAGNAIFANLAATREFARKANDARKASGEPGPILHPGALFAMGLIDELSHALIARYRKVTDPAVLSDGLRFLGSREPDPSVVDHLLLAFTDQFPNSIVYGGQQTPAEWLAANTPAHEAGTTQPMPNREAALEELLMLWLANLNPAFAPFKEFFDDRPLAAQTVYKHVTGEFDDYFATRPPIAPGIGSLLNALRAPMLASPDSLGGQLAYMRDHWADLLGPEFLDTLRRTLLAIDTLKEEEIAIWSIFHPVSHRHHGHGPQGWGAEGFEGDEFVGFGRRLEQPQPLHEYEAFSPDQAWMPTVVLIAKSTYVWLEQLSKKYLRHIYRLDQIPDEELAILASRGINGLWLIGLWERSTASQTIKRLRGQHDAVASAYSLKDYRIADDLGGNYAYQRLRDQAAAHGIRLASDMVPNHMGIDSTWVMEHPDWFLARPDSPFPAYSFNGPDLSTEARFEIKIEDHYYEETDAAVVFQLRERSNGHTQYVYHGNDGTTFAWNDTAQLDYSKWFVREQVIQTILNVARLFPIIRFDAAMTLAKKHVQRLWFPLPGHGGAIPSRAEYAMSQAAFDALMPHEFWREVVDRVAAEVPGTLLLAEAFWLLEGYFVRTLGMHRVYNSAFMNMLRDEENAKYRSYLKKTIEFDPDILKRYVNFMSNPDERTAIDQFGTGDKYFGTCTLLATLPGLPMFGHGQIEAFTEKYGMEYKQARYEEWPNEDLVARHMREIAPLLKNRHLFAESNNFVLYDFWSDHGTVDENVFAYSNRVDNGHGSPDRALILYNNVYQSTRGTIHLSAESMDKVSGQLQSRTLKDALALPTNGDVFLAWRDSARDLEYIRRASDFERSGFTIDLCGYQYAVLLQWRELRSTAEHPWEQLCDSLHGAGVPSLDEALAKLRLRPLHDALRAALTQEILHTFADTAADLATDPPPARATTKPGAPGLASETWVPSSHPPPSPLPAAVSAALSSKATAPKVKPRADALPPVPESELPLPTALEPASPTATNGLPDPRLKLFLDHAQLFFDQAHTAAPESLLPPAALKAKPTLTTQANAAAHLPALERLFAEPWPPTARVVLPTQHPLAAVPASAVWAPVLAWLLLHQLAPDAETAARLFDQLQMRSALAETFAALGVERQNSWRLAARVRILLAFPTPQSVETEPFWADPDVRWLAGLNQTEGITYLNKEAFEELLWWLELPSLLAASLEPIEALVSTIETHLTTHTAAAAKAGYDLDRFRAVRAKPTEQQRDSLKT